MINLLHHQFNLTIQITSLMGGVGLHLLLLSWQLLPPYSCLDI